MRLRSEVPKSPDVRPGRSNPLSKHTAKPQRRFTKTRLFLCFCAVLVSISSAQLLILAQASLRGDLRLGELFHRTGVGASRGPFNRSGIGAAVTPGLLPVACFGGPSTTHWQLV